MNVSNYTMLQKYLADISSKEQISSDDVKNLIIDYQTKGNRDSLERVVDANFKMIVKEANKYASNFKYDNRHFDVYDLIQEGTVGLLQAIKLYDPNKQVGNKFSTYSYYFIKWYMDRFVNINKYDMTISVHNIPVVEKIASRMRQGEEITIEDIQNEYGRNYATSMAIYNIASSLRSVFLDANYNSNSKDDSDRTTANEYVAPQSVNFVDEIADRDYMEYLMSPLSERQKEIITKYYGLFDNKPMTFREIAKEHGYSRQLANKEQKKSLQIMRNRALLDNKKNGGM